MCRKAKHKDEPQHPAFKYRLVGNYKKINTKKADELNEKERKKLFSKHIFQQEPPNSGRLLSKPETYIAEKGYCVSVKVVETKWHSHKQKKQK